MPDTPHDVIVIGCGAAGLSAAREALRAGLAVAGMEANLFGGLITNVNRLDGPVGGAGADVAARMMEEALELGMENLAAQAVALRRDGDALLVDSDAGVHGARTVVVASGARLKRLGLDREEALEGRGVSHCADCDGPMFAGEAVAVVGGGDSALQSALALAGYCRRVHLIHRGPAFRARPHLVDAVQAHAGIEVHWRSQVRALEGADRLEAVRVADAGGRERDLPVAGFFAFVGLEPACDFCPPELARDAQGRLITDEARRTSMPGVHAAGAVRAGCGGLVSDAIEDGAAAARAVAAALADAATQDR